MIYFTTDFKEQKVEKLNKHMSFSIEGSIPVVSKVKEANEIDHKVKNLPDLKMPNVKVTSVNDQIVISFGNTSFFDSGSTLVHPHGQDILIGFAQKFIPYSGNYRISVKGFTDKRRVLQPRKGVFRKYEDNLELSALRSLSAMRVLQKAGIPLNRMEIAGVGELLAINSLLADTQGFNEDKINALSRTIVIVVKAEKESWL
jgi:flagellar motor protein MotB